MTFAFMEQVSSLTTGMGGVLVASSIQLLSFVSVFLAMGFLIDQLEKRRNGWLRQAFGNKGIYATAWIGVPIHEIGHALMCWLFGHRVNEIKLVQFGAADGTLGYVNHSYDKANLLHRVGLFFIGIAPLLMGGTVLVGLLYVCLPDVFQVWVEAAQASRTLGDVLMASWLFISSLFAAQHFLMPMFYLFLLLAIPIASHMSLSPADIRGARSGVLSLFVLLVLFNLVAFSGNELTFTDYLIHPVNLFVLSILLLALFLASWATAIAYVLTRWTTRRRNEP